MDNPVKASPSEFMAGFNRSADGLSITFDQSLIREAFYADCSEADIALARSCLVPQATAIMTAPIAASDAAWGSLPRSFIACTNDNALTLEGQRGMLERVGVDRVVELETSHSPFFSAPGELAARLVDLA